MQTIDILVGHDKLLDQLSSLWEKLFVMCIGPQQPKILLIFVTQVVFNCSQYDYPSGVLIYINHMFVLLRVLLTILATLNREVQLKLEILQDVLTDPLVQSCIQEQLNLFSIIYTFLRLRSYFKNSLICFCENSSLK